MISNKPRGNNTATRITISRSGVIVTAIVALIISLAFVLGYQVSIIDQVSLSGLTVLEIVVIAALVFIGLIAAHFFLNRRDMRFLGGFSPIIPHITIKKVGRAALLVWLILLLLWLPILLAGYPGFFNYDSGLDWLMQWSQIESGILNAHHPIIHTLFLEVTIKAGIALFGSFNAGVFLSVCIQALLVSAAFSLALSWLMKEGLGLFGLIVSVAYLALDPIIGMFAFSTTKDVLFAAIVLLYGIGLTCLYRKGQNGELKFRSLIPLVVLCFFMVILRTNALVAMLPIVPLVLLCLKSRKRIGGGFVLATVASLFFAFVWLGPVSTLMNVDSSPIGKWNSLCVAEQQIARCSVDDAVTSQDKELISKKLVGLGYKKNLSDIARGAFMNPNSCGGKDMIDLYFYLGFKYPTVYTEAVLYQTEDAWSPFSVIDCYSNNEEVTSVFSINQQLPSERDSKFPELLNVLTWLSSARGIEAIPVVSLIVSIPFYLLMLLLCLWRSLVINNRQALVFLIPLAILALTNLLGPCALIRYYLYLYFSLPFMLYLSFGRSSAQCLLKQETRGLQALSARGAG